jgi:hypothetical protein
VIDQARYAEWVQLSHRVRKFEPFMVVAVQGLGQLDAKLAAEDAEYLSDCNSDQDDLAQSLDLTERVTRSYLWVLGAYELVRSIDQRCRNDPSLVSAHVVTLISDTKTQFERVRVPLAKYEPARKFSTTDSTVAFPAIDRAKGVAWSVAAGTIISRDELAQCFRQMLLAL